MTRTLPPPLKVRLLTPTARVPTRANPDDSGLDLCADEDVNIYPGGRALIRTGIAVCPPPGYETQVRPRSGMSKAGIVAAFGTIDRDYTGDIGVILYNLADDMRPVRRGDRIAQLVVAPVLLCGTEVVEELDDTERGADGFGSTGR